MSRRMEKPRKFLPPEWHLANQVHFGSAEAERSRSERLTAESQRLIEESEKIARRMQQNARKKLEQRIKGIKFWSQELELKLDEMKQEIEMLLTFKTRVERALESCSEPLRVVLQCLVEREKRVGVDLVHDEAERELIKEKEVIEWVTSLLQRTLEQTNEQIRRNRSVKYHLEKDLRDKFQAEQIDDHCSILTSTSPNMSDAADRGATTQRASVTPEDWENFSNINISKAEREKNNSLSLRALVDSLLEQTAADLRRQHLSAGTALEMRVQETRSAKGQLEYHLAKVLEEIANQERSIASLQVAIADKQGPLKVAKTRLAARSERPGVELCRDPAQVQLQVEVQELTVHIKRLSESLLASQMELRTLAASQLTLEEEIQVKSHSLYIDEVICTQLRQPLSVHSF